MPYTGEVVNKNGWDGWLRKGEHRSVGTSVMHLGSPPGEWAQRTMFAVAELTVSLNILHCLVYGPHPQRKELAHGQIDEALIWPGLVYN